MILIFLLTIKIDRFGFFTTWHHTCLLYSWLFIPGNAHLYDRCSGQNNPEIMRHYGLSSYLAEGFISYDWLFVFALLSIRNFLFVTSEFLMVNELLGTNCFHQVPAYVWLGKIYWFRHNQSSIAKLAILAWKLRASARTSLRQIAHVACVSQNICDTGAFYRCFLQKLTGLIAIGTLFITHKNVGQVASDIIENFC